MGARVMARQLELTIRRAEADFGPVADHYPLMPADDLRDADSGRLELAPPRGLVLTGRYLRRARRLASKTQQQLAAESGISQAMISRAERGRAPGMSLERFVRLCQPLGRLFPLGTCPHDHDCAWQPIKPPDAEQARAKKLLDYLRRKAGDG